MMNLKRDARHLDNEDIHKLRRHVIRLHLAGDSRKTMCDESGLSYSAVVKIIRLYTEKGWDGLIPGERGRRVGQKRRLELAQESYLQQLICEFSPRALDLPLLFWEHDAVSQLITRECGVTLPNRTVDHYIKRWHFRPNPTAKTLHDELSRMHEKPRDFSAQKKKATERTLWLDVVVRPCATHLPQTPEALALQQSGNTGSQQPMHLLYVVNGRGKRFWHIASNGVQQEEMLLLCSTLRQLFGGPISLMLGRLDAATAKTLKPWLHAPGPDVQKLVAIDNLAMSETTW